MDEVDFCAWVCPVCCENRGWTEEREIPEGEEVFCENCGNLWDWKGRVIYED